MSAEFLEIFPGVLSRLPSKDFLNVDRVCKTWQTVAFENRDKCPEVTVSRVRISKSMKAETYRLLAIIQNVVINGERQPPEMMKAILSEVVNRNRSRVLTLECCIQKYWAPLPDTVLH